MQIKTANDLGALIRDRRRQLAWTQTELAKRVGVSRIWILQLEKGKPTAQLGLALRALKELGVGLDAPVSALAGSLAKGAEGVDLDGIINRTRSSKP